MGDGLLATSLVGLVGEVPDFDRPCPEDDPVATGWAEVECALDGIFWPSDLVVGVKSEGNLEFGHVRTTCLASGREDEFYIIVQT